MLNILYEDEHVLAVDKPAGLLVIPGREPAERTLRDEVTDYLAPGGQRPYVVHRLDRGTSGVVLFARTAEAHRALNLSFDGHEVEKVYLALVTGDLEGEDVIKAMLHTARRGRMRPARQSEMGLKSMTRWKAIERFGRFTLLEVRPETGRAHQIRVHLKFIGHPLAFDPSYGRKQSLTARDLNPDAPKDIVLTRSPLHAASIRLPHPSGKGTLFVEAPLPNDFARALKVLRRSQYS